MLVEDATNVIQELTGISISGPDMVLEWYATARAGIPNTFTLYQSTNLQDNMWQPVVSNIAGHPLGFTTWDGVVSSNAPTLFYRLGRSL